MAGRRPVPDHLKLVTGNPGRRPVDLDAAPALEPVAPECPDFLDAMAQAEWARIVPELLKVGLLTRVDRAALGMYCQAFSRWQKAEQKIRELSAKQESQQYGGSGLVTRAANGFEQMSQWLVISNRAQEQLKSYLVEFGMSPSSRARVKAMKVQGSLFPDDDPMEALLRAGSRAA